MKTKVNNELLNKIDSLNLEVIAKQKTSKELYKYSKEILESKDFKQAKKTFRKKIRKEKDNISFVVVKDFKEKSENLEKSILNFRNFYKENFVCNDYSLQSFTNVSAKDDENKIKIYEVALQICKE